MAPGCLIDINISKSEFEVMNSLLNITFMDETTKQSFQINEGSFAHCLDEFPQLRLIGEKAYNTYVNSPKFKTHLLLGFHFFITEDDDNELETNEVRVIVNGIPYLNFNIPLCEKESDFIIALYEKVNGFVIKDFPNNLFETLIEKGVSLQLSTDNNNEDHIMFYLVSYQGLGQSGFISRTKLNDLKTELYNIFKNNL